MTRKTAFFCVGGGFYPLLLLCLPAGPLIHFRPNRGLRNGPFTEHTTTRAAHDWGAGVSARELHMEAYERLRQLVESAADDVNKAMGGNKAAGTRVRKAMQDVKSAAQEVRKSILESRATSEG